MPIEILNERAYRGYLEPVGQPGNQPIHLARVCFSDGVTRRAYVKLYPGDSHEIVNEITGHLLAQAAGLRTPEHVAIVLVPKVAIPNLPGWAKRGRAKTVPCWCAVDVGFPSIKLHFNLQPRTYTDAQLQPIIAELQKSDEIPAVVALDDLVSNVDRNLGNLLRLRKHVYVLIDHGQILGGPRWTASTLPDPRHQHQNKLRTLLGATANSCDYRQRLSSISRATHPSALQIVCEELLIWWCDLLDEQDIEAAAAFLDARAEVDNICARYHVLPV